jgi:hypothetical protein
MKIIGIQSYCGQNSQKINLKYYIINNITNNNNNNNNINTTWSNKLF